MQNSLSKLIEFLHTLIPPAGEGTALRKLQQQTDKLHPESELQRAKNKLRTHGNALTPTKPSSHAPPPLQPEHWPLPYLHHLQFSIPPLEHSMTTTHPISLKLVFRSGSRTCHLPHKPKQTTYSRSSATNASPRNSSKKRQPDTDCHSHESLNSLPKPSNTWSQPLSLGRLTMPPGSTTTHPRPLQHLSTLHHTLSLFTSHPTLTNHKPYLPTSLFAFPSHTYHSTKWRRRFSQLHITPNTYHYNTFSHPNAVYVKLHYDQHVSTHQYHQRGHTYIGSTGTGIAKREYNRHAKLKQLQHKRPISAELSLRYWHSQQTLHHYSTIYLSHHDTYDGYFSDFAADNVPSPNQTYTPLNAYMHQQFSENSANIHVPPSKPPRPFAAANTPTHLESDAFRRMAASLEEPDGSRVFQRDTTQHSPCATLPFPKPNPSRFPFNATHHLKQRDTEPWPPQSDIRHQNNHHHHHHHHGPSLPPTGRIREAAHKTLRSKQWEDHF